MAFDLRSLASNIGNSISNAWNSKKRKEVSAGINTSVNQGAGNLAQVAKNTYNSSKPIVTGAVKSMATTVGNAIKQKAPVVAQNFKSTATLAGQGLRGLVNNYVQKNNKVLDPRADKQIAIDKNRYATPTKTVVRTQVKTPTATPTRTPISPTATPTQQPQKTGVKKIDGFVRAGLGTQYYDIINKSSAENNIHPGLLAGLLFQESSLQNNLTNSQPVYNQNGQPVIDPKTGRQLFSIDRGIAQINNIAHPEISDEQANDPNFAIPWAAKEIAYNIKHFNGDINRALAAYNVGRGGANVQGPELFGGGPKGQTYLNNIAQHLSPELKKYLGLKTGSIKTPSKKK